MSEELPLSPVQLVDLRFLRSLIEVKSADEPPMEPGKPALAELNLEREIGYDPSGPPFWMVGLQLQIGPVAAVPYVISVYVRGLFQVAPRRIESQTDAITHVGTVAVNCSSLLWGHLREHIAAQTARFLHGVYILPAVQPTLFLRQRLPKDVVDALWPPATADAVKEAPARQAEESSPRRRPKTKKRRS